MRPIQPTGGIPQPGRRRTRRLAEGCCNRTPPVADPAGASLTGPRPLATDAGCAPGAADNLLQLRLSHPALAEVLANRPQELVERLVGQQVPLDQRTDVLGRGLPGVAGLLLDCAE